MLRGRRQRDHFIIEYIYIESQALLYREVSTSPASYSLPHPSTTSLVRYPLDSREKELESTRQDIYRRMGGEELCSTAIIFIRNLPYYL